MKIIPRILFGIDMSLGIVIYVLTSWIYGESFDAFILFFSIFFSFLPDMDFIPYLILKKKMRLISHWIFCHHPVLFIPIIAAAGWCSSVWHGSDKYILFIALSGITAHFIHDSWNEVGLHWFSPFSWKHYSLEGGLHCVSKETVEQYYRKVLRIADIRAVQDEFEVRLKKLSAGSCVFFGGSVIFLLYFFFLG